MQEIQGVSVESRAEQHTLTIQGNIAINDILTSAIGEGLRVEHVVQRRDDLEAFFMQDIEKKDSDTKDVEKKDSDTKDQKSNSPNA